MKDLISIIIPVYNVQKHISKCVSSILNQSYSNFEAIFIDDGSPDNSILIAKKIVGNDPRFIFLAKENGGQGSARNLGIDTAKGNYLAFIDSDDFVEIDFLEKLHSQIISAEADICLCDISMITENKKTGHIINDVKGYYHKNDFLLCADTISSFMWDKLFKKDVFNGMRFDESIRTYEDSHFVFRLIHEKKLTHTPYPLYNYVQHSSSTTNSYNKSYLKDKLAVQQCYISFAKKNYDTKIIEPYMNYCYLKSYVYTVAAGFSRYPDATGIHKFQKSLNRERFSIYNIMHLFPSERKIKYGLILFLISPFFFKVVIKTHDAIKKLRIKIKR